MCQDCGCSVSTTKSQVAVGGAGFSVHPKNPLAIHVVQNLMSENDNIAAHNRGHFDDHGVLVINMLSSPGSGKTSLLESTIKMIGDQFRIAVIEGDLETELDAERIRKHGVPAVQIMTGQTCHLDAQMIHDAVHALDLSNIDILFIENVGNLVCPAAFDLGQSFNVALLSVTEGDDKPAKYPVLFRKADVVLLSKVDLLSAIGDFSISRAEENIRHLASSAQVLCASSRSAKGLDPWIGWLTERVMSMHRRWTPGENRVS